MGTSFQTFALPGAHGAEVVDALTDWYERRGFPMVEGDSLFGDPGDDERWCIVAADERWTVVVDAHRDEHERLGWELARLGTPLLELWVQGSDVWGYRLFEGRLETESFCSNPRYFGGDAHDDETVPHALCRVAGLAGRERELMALFRQRKLFAEQALSRFADAIGAPAAATDYAYWGDPDSPPAQGYTVTRLRFQRPSAPDVIDIHSDRYPRRSPRREPRGQEGSPPLPPDTAATLAALRTLGVLFSAVFSVLRFLLAPIFLLVSVVVRLSRRKSAEAILRTFPGVVVDERTVVVARHGMRFPLPPGAEIAPQMFALGLFAFRLNDVVVWCTPCRRNTLADQLTIPHDAIVDDDVRYAAGDRAVRGLVHHEENANGKEAGVHQIRDIVDGPRALYVFWARTTSPLDFASRKALRDAISALRFEQGVSGLGAFRGLRRRHGGERARGSGRSEADGRRWLRSVPDARQPSSSRSTASPSSQEAIWRSRSAGAQVHEERSAHRKCPRTSAYEPGEDRQE